MVLSLFASDSYDDWPRPLRKLGYVVRVIEGTIENSWRSIKPDIVAVAVDDDGGAHALVIECKAGPNIDTAQDAAYARLTLEQVQTLVGASPRLTSHTVAYAINAEHEVRVRRHTRLPLLVFRTDSVYGVGDFGEDGLNSTLRDGVPLTGFGGPHARYAFSVHSSDEDVDRVVLPQIVRYFRRHPDRVGMHMTNLQFAEEFLRLTHKSHDTIFPKHRRELAGKIKRSITRCERNGTLWKAIGAAGLRGAA